MNGGLCPGSGLSAALKKLSRKSVWQLCKTVPLRFPSGHPQGMVKLGKTFYVSTVHISARPCGAPGPGEGWLYKIDEHGTLLEKTALGGGGVYHPGGIDYDGRFIWAPVAEYRPDSRAYIYRVDPVSMQAEKVFSYDDHIGGLICDTENRALYGTSWGARRFYRWPLDGQGGAQGSPRDSAMIRNTSHYIDYQDCHFIGGGEALCSGLNVYHCGGKNFELGGIEILGLKTLQPLYQLPVELWSPSGRVMTQNPFWMEEKDGLISASFIPDDDDSAIYVFEVRP
jgi:hypothetical protein